MNIKIIFSITIEFTVSWCGSCWKIKALSRISSRWTKTLSSPFTLICTCSCRLAWSWSLGIWSCLATESNYNKHASLIKQIFHCYFTNRISNVSCITCTSVLQWKYIDRHVDSTRVEFLHVTNKTTTHPLLIVRKPQPIHYL